MNFLKKYHKEISLVAGLAIFITANLVAKTVLAQADPIIPCDGTPENPCGFPEFIILIDNSISFVLKYLVLPLSAVVLAYGGFLYLTSSGNPGKRAKANTAFTSLLWGLFFCLAAWVIVKIILTTFGYDDATFSPIVQ